MERKMRNSKRTILITSAALLLAGPALAPGDKANIKVGVSVSSAEMQNGPDYPGRSLLQLLW
jgi:hypothetical protein